MRNIRPCEMPDYDKYAETKVTKMGNITEVVTMAKKPLGPPIKRLDKDRYQDLRTGQVCEYDHGKTRADSNESIRRTLAYIRALINTNVTEPDNVRWVTLTYAENMTDTERLYEDYRKFWQKFCRWCKAKGYERPEYISVQEPQGRGAWHVHAFFIWPTKAPYVDNNADMARMWGHGFTKTKALQDVDNVGAYFSAYLGDMPLDEYNKLPMASKDPSSPVSIEVKEFTNAQELTKQKKFVKGGRLCLYPAGMNIVRKTKGIKQPIVEHMTYAEAQKKVSSGKPTFSCSYEIVSDDGQICNVLTKSYYNSLRK